MKKQRIFEGFSSGYTVAVRTDYDNRMIGLLMSAWDDAHKLPAEPQPRDVEEKVKGGTRKRKLLNEPNYLAALQQWEVDKLNHAAERAEYQTRLVLQHGIDPESIDMGLVTRARARLEELYDTPGEENDIIFYLNLIGDAGQGKPGDEDYRPNELFELLRFISLEKGAPGALVSHLLLTTFQNEDTEQEDGPVSRHLGSPATAGSQTKASPARTPNADTGGESGGL